MKRGTPMKRVRLRKRAIRAVRRAGGLEQDRKYLDWIRTRPCLLCGAAAEAAHSGLRGLGQKSDDREAIPLCSYHHRTGRTSQHTLGKGFEAVHNIDVGAQIARLNRLYEDRNVADQQAN